MLPPLWSSTPNAYKNAYDCACGYDDDGYGDCNGSCDYPWKSKTTNRMNNYSYGQSETCNYPWSPLMNMKMTQMMHHDVCYGGLDGPLGVLGGVRQIECCYVYVDQISRWY